MTTETYQVEFDITECTIKDGSGKQGPWKRHTLKGYDTPTYSGFSLGQNPVKELADLKTGDYVSLQCRDDDTGKYHNIVKILDVGKAPSRQAEKQGEGTTKSVASDRDSKIEAQVAIKAIVELAVGGVIPKDHPLVVTAVLWCAEKLGVKTVVGSKLPEKEGTPQNLHPDAISKGEDIAERVTELYDWVSKEWNLTGDKNIQAWLTGYAKIPPQRISTEPEKVLAELKAHFERQSK